jgi:hypothetical protein
MSYNGTVRCSYCYNTKHNRRGCPQLKKYIKENPDSYTAQTFNERAKHAKVRTCRYCEEEGHNRRTCRDLQNDKEYYRVLCASMRADALAWMKDNGVGVGALVATSRYGGAPGQVGIVRGAHLAWITPARADHTLPVDNPTALHPFLSKCQVISVANAKHPNEPRYVAALKVLNPVKFNAAPFVFPEGWAEGRDTVTLDDRDKHFKEHDRYTTRKWTLKMPVEDYEKK